MTKNTITMSQHVLLTVLLAVVCAAASAGEYQSGTNRFTIKYDSDWKTTASPDLTIELALIPNSGACSSIAFLSVGAFYDQKLSGITTDDFLKVATGDAITRHIKNTPLVSNFKLLREGKAKLGDVNAYEVLMSYTTPKGARYRHTFVTFNKGYMYNVSFHSSPESYRSDYEVAKKVLKTFKFTR